jgi:dolichyl-phosphate-mannose--protein O-mannosyl transferase
MLARAQMPFAERLVDLNHAMWKSSSGMTVKHPYASRWYDWPFMMRTIDFWAQYRDPLLSRIYLLGNPVVWWATGYAMLFLLVNFVPKLPDLLARRQPSPAAPTERFLIAAYLANMLPFTLIGRVQFLYHYLPALGFALIALGLLIDRSGRHARWLGTTLLGLAAAAFVYWAPLTYGLEITRAQFDARFWVGTWK